MSEGPHGDKEEVVITGDALVKRCPQQDQRRGDVVEPDYGGRMQVRTAVTVAPPPVPTQPSLFRSLPGLNTDDA